MIEIETTPDAVRLSYLQAVLMDAGIESFVFDDDTPWPGVMPKRLLVVDRDAEMARCAIRSAEAH